MTKARKRRGLGAAFILAACPGFVYEKSRNAMVPSGAPPRGRPANAAAGRPSLPLTAGGAYSHVRTVTTLNERLA
jgi:hypothetical protein